MAAITPTIKLSLTDEMQSVTVNNYYTGERFIVDVATGDFAEPIDPLVMVIAASRGSGPEEAIDKRSAVPTENVGVRRWDFPASTFNGFAEGNTFYFDVFLYEGTDLTREPVVRFQGSTTKKVTINPGPPPSGDGSPAVPLSNTALPEITGTAAVGNTLSASQGSWAGSAPRTYSYRWTRDGSDIAGATSSTYTLVAADDGADVSCDVTADDGFTTVTTSAVVVTVDAEPTPSGDPGIVYGTDSYTVQNGDQITVSGLGAPYDGTYDLPVSDSPPSYLVEPFKNGASGAGNVQTLNQGLAWGSEGGLTCTVTLKRGGVAFVTDEPFPLDHSEDYTYTELSTDPDDGGVTAEITLDDGTNQTTVTLTLVVETQAAIVGTAPAGATVTNEGDLLGDGRTWTLYDLPHDGSTSDLTGNFVFSQPGQAYVALVGGGSGGSSRRYNTSSSDFGGEGGSSGEVLDFAEISLTGTQSFVIGKGGIGAQPGGSINTRGGVGSDTTFAGLTARGGNASTDGSETYSNGATPDGFVAKGGGAGAGGDGQDAQGQFTPGGKGGPGLTITFGSLSRTYGFGGGGAGNALNSIGGAGGNPSAPSNGAGPNYPSYTGSYVAPTDAAAGTGSGGGGAAGWETQPLAVAADGSGGRLLLLVENT